MSMWRLSGWASLHTYLYVASLTQISGQECNAMECIA